MYAIARFSTVAAALLIVHGLLPIGSTHAADKAPIKPKVVRLPTLAKILDRKLTVHYRRAHLGEVVYDLQWSVGLDAAFPKPLDGTFTVDLTGKMSVRQILESLAKAGSLKLEYREECAVSWKPASDVRLAALEAIIKDKQAHGRCRAIEELAQLADERIYTILFWAMAEGNEPMTLAAARQLYAQHLQTVRFGKNFEHFAAGLQRIIVTRPLYDRHHFIELAAATRSPHCGELLVPFFKEPQSQSYVVYAIGRTRDPRCVQPLLELLKTALPWDPNQDTGVPPASQEAIIGVLAQIGDPATIEGWHEQASREKDPHKLLELGGALVAADDDRGFEILKKLLSNKEPSPAVRAPKGAPGGGSPGPPLSFRSQVVQAMGGTRDERALQPLLDALRDHQAEVRQTAAMTLMRMQDERAAVAIHPLLENEGTRWAAVIALLQIGDPRSNDLLAKQLDRLPPHLQKMVAGSLLQQGDERGRSALKKLLKGADEFEQTSLHRMMAQAGDRDATQALLSQLKPQTLGASRASRDAAEALGRVRDVSTLPALAQAVLELQEDESFYAAQAIANMRDPKGTDQGIALLRHKYSTLRVWGARILGWAKDPRGTDALVAALQDEDAAVRQHVSRALIAIGDRRSLNAVIPMLQDPDPLVRRYTAEALGRTRDPKIIAALFAGLDDKEWNVRASCAAALLRTGDAGTIKRLVLLAQKDQGDSNSPMPARFASLAFITPHNAYVYGHKSDPCVLEELVLLTGDMDPKIRLSAAVFLSQMLDPCAIDPLLRLLKEPDEATRKTVRLMLTSYRDDPRVKNLLGP
jgi:HEAT repeat protein